MSTNNAVGETQQVSPKQEVESSVVRIPSNLDEQWAASLNSALPPGTTLAATSDGQLLLISANSLTLPTEDEEKNASEKPSTLVSVPTAQQNGCAHQSPGLSKKVNSPPALVSRKWEGPRDVSLPPPVQPCRDEKQRRTHNLVEQRRRNKINTWIMNLASLLPEEPNGASGTLSSKGSILSNACDYLRNLRSTNQALQQENASLRREIEMIHSLLEENGILLRPTTSNNDGETGEDIVDVNPLEAADGDAPTPDV